MLAKIARMLQRVRLTDEDLEIAEDACLRNAARCRRKSAIERAASWDWLTHRIARRAVLEFVDLRRGSQNAKIK